MAGIPPDQLKCTLCKKEPTFSDVSHLLTHLGSKGHLASEATVAHLANHRAMTIANRAREANDQQHLLANQQAGIAQHTAGIVHHHPGPAQNAAGIVHHHPGPAQNLQAPNNHPDFVNTDQDKLDRFNAWKRTFNIDRMLAQRANEKNRKKLAKEAKEREEKRIRQEQRQNAQPIPAALAAQAAGPRENRNVLGGLRPAQPTTPTPQGGRRPLARPRQQEPDVSPEDVLNSNKLKGFIVPGMGMFDSATEEDRKKRNQRKDGSNVEKMKRASEQVQPTEMVWLNGLGGNAEARDIYRSPSPVNLSDEEEAARLQAVKRRNSRKQPKARFAAKAPAARTGAAQAAPARVMPVEVVPFAAGPAPDMPGQAVHGRTAHGRTLHGQALPRQAAPTQAAAAPAAGLPANMQRPAPAGPNGLARERARDNIRIQLPQTRNDMPRVRQRPQDRHMDYDEEDDVFYTRPATARGQRQAGTLNVGGFGATQGTQPFPVPAHPRPALAGMDANANGFYPTPAVRRPAPETPMNQFPARNTGNTFFAPNQLGNTMTGLPAVPGGAAANSFLLPRQQTQAQASAGFFQNQDFDFLAFGHQGMNELAQGQQAPTAQMGEFAMNMATNQVGQGPVQTHPLYQQQQQQAQQQGAAFDYWLGQFVQKDDQDPGSFFG